MKTVARIIDLNGGLAALADHPIRIDPPCDGLMRLCIERVGTVAGTDGAPDIPIVSLAHYHEMNGDLVADPDMTFAVVADPAGGPVRWWPMTFEMPAARKPE